LSKLVDRVAKTVGPGPHLDFNVFLAAVEADAESHGVKLPAKRMKLLKTELAERDEKAQPVILKVHKAGKANAAPLYGRYEMEVDGKSAVVEYEPDTALRDTEQVPFLEKDGIEAFFVREVQPHLPDAWIAKTATKIGYEVSFTRYFYKPQPLRSLDEIRSDIVALEEEAKGLLGEIIGGAIR
jgi:type I restriction enzyme M protein